MIAIDRSLRPADLLTLAARAMELADDVRAAQNRLRAAPDEPTRRAGFRLDDAAGELRRVHDELRATAEGLKRVVNRGTCPADWGACPDHGATLRSSGNNSWCAIPGCRTWDYDRLSSPCSEMATHLVTGPGPAAEPGRMCAGHAREAATVLYGEPIPVDEIADHLNRSSSMIRRHFKRLAQEEFIEQRDDGWYLTDRWSRLFEDVP